MDLATVRQRLAARWGVSVPVHEVYVEHHERVVFRTASPTGRRVVVKAFADPCRPAAEAAALHAASAAGVRVPEVVERFADVLVLGWLDGRPLLSASPDRHWAAAGSTLRRLHDHAATDGVTGSAGIYNSARVNNSAGINGFADWWGWFRAFLPQARQRTRELFPADVAARLCQSLEVGTARLCRGLEIGSQAGANDVPPRCLLHGDSASIHWRIGSDGSAGMLDLGDACVGDPVWDLVVLTHWDEARLPAVLDGYRADDPLRARVGRRYEPYRVVRHLLAVDWLIDHGYDPAATLRELGRIAARPTEVATR